MDSSQILDEFFANMPRLKQIMGKVHDTDANSPTRAQMGVLYCLSKRGAQSIKEIAKDFGMTPSGATQLVDSLVKQELVTREEASDDRRRVSLSLTAKGTKVMKELHKARIDAFKKFLSPLSQEELAQLFAIQKKLIEHFQNS